MNSVIILRYRALRMVFRWQNPWNTSDRDRLMIDGITGQVMAAVMFLFIYAGAWLHYRRSERARILT